MDVPSQTTEAETETESALMLLPVGDLFNHGAQSLSRTKYYASSDSVTIVTATSFERGDEVVINYGNHSVSEFLVRYGFVPQGQLRSVSMEIAPWPLPSMQEATEVHAALGEAAVQPYSATERQLHRKLLAVRQHGPQEGFLNLFREGLDADSNFALRMLHLRQGGELSAYAIVSVCCPFCPFICPHYTNEFADNDSWAPPPPFPSLAASRTLLLLLLHRVRSGTASVRSALAMRRPWLCICGRRAKRRSRNFRTRLSRPSVMISSYSKVAHSQTILCSTSLLGIGSARSLSSPVASTQCGHRPLRSLSKAYLLVRLYEKARRSSSASSAQKKCRNVS